jgi:hypothetical protein
MKVSFPVTGIDLGFFVIEFHEMIERYEWAIGNGLKVTLAGDILEDDIILEGPKRIISKWVELFFDVGEPLDVILKQYTIKD